MLIEELPTLTNYFLRLFLHAQNSLEAPSKQRCLCTFCAMIWFTSLTGVHDTPKRNFSCGHCLTISIGIKFDTEVVRHASLEPCEHAFGMLRQSARELTASKIMDLIDGVMRRTKLMLRNIFKRLNDEMKGCQDDVK